MKKSAAEVLAGMIWRLPENIFPISGYHQRLCRRKRWQETHEMIRLFLGIDE
jgi:uncharacterized paraquat-inducible protein A